MRENKVAYEDISDINPAQIINNGLKIGKRRKNVSKSNKLDISNKRNNAKNLKNFLKFEDQ